MNTACCAHRKAGKAASVKKSDMSYVTQPPRMRRRGLCPRRKPALAQAGGTFNRGVRRIVGTAISRQRRSGIQRGRPPGRIEGEMLPRRRSAGRALQSSVLRGPDAMPIAQATPHMISNHPPIHNKISIMPNKKHESRQPLFAIGISRLSLSAEGPIAGLSNFPTRAGCHCRFAYFMPRGRIN